METRRRSLVKAVSWQFSGLIMMALLGFLFTGSVSAGGALALVSTGIGFVCYLLHERLWTAIRWGIDVGRSEGDVDANAHSVRS